MNIFLTGHGFIATALKRHFEGQGHSVYIPERKHITTISPYSGDILARFFDTHQPDVIIHTSAYGNMSTQADPYQTIRANVLLLHRLLEVSKDIPYKAFINFSTSAIQLPTQTLYSTTKAMGEQLSTFYAKTYSKPIVNVRPYSVTGVGEQEAHLIPTLIRAAYTGEEVPFVPEPTHDFIDIDDVVKGIVKVIDNPAPYMAEPVNLGTGHAYSNREVLDVVQRVTGREVHIRETAEAYRPYDALYWVAPWGFLSEHKSLEQIIKEMVAAHPI